MNRSFISRVYPLLILAALLFGQLLFMNQAFGQESLRTRVIDGKKYLLHKVVPKESWSSVSRKYSVEIPDLQKANPGVTTLKIGQIIQVPASTAEVSPVKPISSPKSNGKEVYHTVVKGETMYRISKQYGITVDELQKLNNLTGTTVSVGQKLIVSKGAKPIEIKPEPVVQQTPVEVTDKPVENPVKEPAVVNIPRSEEKIFKPDTPVVSSTNSRSGSTEKDIKSGSAVDKISETGVAAWITEGDLNQNKFYALHRTAPVGTIIKVTNRMNNNSVFVKVVGVLPDTGDNDNILIKITQAAAQRIGALDQRFQSELTYGVSK